MQVMQCRLISTMVPEGPPYYASGAVRAIVRCETHNWTFDGPVMEMCPIGRIELLTEDSINRVKGQIALATDHAIERIQKHANNT